MACTVHSFHPQKTLVNFQKSSKDPITLNQNKWNKNTTLIIISIILLTTSIALIQVTLPLDLVKGGVYRKELSEQFISFLISFQLILLLFLELSREL